MPNNVIPYNELQVRLGQNHTVTKLQKYNATIDGQCAYRRNGSRKPQGWQVTIRDDFRASTLQGQGYLPVSRGPGLLVPLRDLRQMIGHELGQSHTVDIFIRFGPGAQMECKGRVHDLSRFLLP